MLDVVKKIGVIVAIAILFAFFSFSLIDVIQPRPDYSDVCKTDRPSLPQRVIEADCQPLDVPEIVIDDCYERNGYIQYRYDSLGCPVSYHCETCQVEYELRIEQHRLVGFMVTGIMGVIAILVGLYMRPKSAVVEWIFSGFLIGGVISVFIGTTMYFSHMDRFVRPIVLLLEIALIVFIAVKTYLRQDAKPRRKPQK